MKEQKGTPFSAPYVYMSERNRERSMNKRWIVALAVCLCFIAVAIGGCAGQENASGIMALKTDTTEFKDSEILEKLQFYCDFYGMDKQVLREDTQMWNKMLDDIIYDYAFADLAFAEAQQTGLAIPDVQTEEVQQIYQSLLADIDQVIQANRKQELSGDTLTKAQDKYLAGMGFTREAFLQYAQKKAVEERVKQEWAKSDEVSEQELQEQYDYALQSQKKYMDIDPAYALDLIQNGTQTIVYYPQGLRYIRTITVPFEAETRGKAGILYSEGKLREYNILMEQAEAEILPQIEAIRSQIAQGASFETLSEQTGIDFAGNEKGQLVWEGDNEMISDFKVAVQQLKDVGDIVECNTYMGHQFIQYAAVASQGEVSFDEVKEALKKDVLSTKRLLQYDEEMRKRFREKVEAGEILLDLSTLKIEEENNG